MKVSSTIENIFAIAVGLDQSGGLRNTVYAIKDEIYILNHDHTVFLRFKLRASEASFKNPVSFRANDYDSSEFEEEDGKIVFFNNAGNYQRKKSCSVPDMTPEQSMELFGSFTKPEKGFSVKLGKPVVELLENGLSHIELVGNKGEALKLIQRNIYSGGIIEIQEKSEGGLFSPDSILPFDLEPVAIRTSDFRVLFSFWDNIQIEFAKQSTGGDYLYITGKSNHNREITGIIACCIYDEIIEIKEAYNGRKEQKVRRRQ
jgi:hypothetical protein